MPTHNDSSGSTATTGEYIGSQPHAPNAAAGHVLECRPPERLQQRAVLQPVRDGLLADALASTVRGGIASEVLAESGGKSRLAVADLNGLRERGYVVGNVVSLHGARERTTSALVVVNKNAGATVNKRPCTLSGMSLPKKKPAEKPQRIRKAQRGADGRTVGERLAEAMRSHDPPYDSETGQTRLAEECQRIWASGWGKKSTVKIKQQNINELLHNKQHSSRYISVLAYVLNVRCLWLQFGIGPRDMEAIDEALVRRILAEVKKNEGSDNGSERPTDS